MIFRNLVFTFLIFLFFSCQSSKSEISNIGDDLTPDNWSTDLKEFQSENNTSFCYLLVKFTVENEGNNSISLSKFMII